MFNLAIVGLGPWGRRLVGSVQGKSDAAKFVAAATRTPAKAEQFAADAGIALGAEMEPLLADSAIEGVIIASPGHDHVAQTMAAIEAGKHVLVVKPLALAKADAEALYDAAERRGVFLAVGYERCFLPAADELRRRVRAGAIGRIVHAEGAYCVDRYLTMTRDNWKTDIAVAPPGALADHILYMMIELIGPVTELQATGRHLATDLSVADTSTVTLRFPGGESGLLTAIGVTPSFARLHFFGTEGWAELRDANVLEMAPRKGDHEVIEFPPFDAVREQVESFVAAAEGRAEYRISRENAIAGVAAVEAMGISASTGQPVQP